MFYFKDLLNLINPLASKIVSLYDQTKSRQEVILINVDLSNQTIRSAQIWSMSQLFNFYTGLSLQGRNDVANIIDVALAEIPRLKSDERIVLIDQPPGLFRGYYNDGGFEAIVINKDQRNTLSKRS